MTKMRKPRDQLAETANVVPDAMAQMGRQKKKYCVKCGKGNHTTNGCWIVCKQLSLPLSDAAKAHFQK